MNYRIHRLVVAWVVGCTVLALSATYYQAVVADRLASSPANPRMAIIERGTVRGLIVDRVGNPISDSYGPGPSSRVFHGAGSLAPLVGYSHPVTGKSGIEAAFDLELMGRRSRHDMTGLLATLSERPKQGYTVGLTIDPEVQRACEQGLAGRRGAAVVLDATTGEVLAMASSPWYVPDYPSSAILDSWRDNAGRADSPLLCRPVSGLYPPGSTFKMVIGAAALDMGVTTMDEVFECTGSIRAGGSVIHDADGPHGSIDLRTAFALSCNTVFVELALRMGERLPGELERFGLSRYIPFDVPTATASLGAGASKGTGDALGQLAIGQGDLLVTPLNMALIAAAVVNDGVMMSPYVVAEVRRPDGTPVRTRVPKPLSNAMTPQAARAVAEGMRSAVDYGTARYAGGPGYGIGGKTGTAQNPHGMAHSWFAGFGTDGAGRRVATAVIVENGGAGGLTAAPIGGNALKAALRQEVSG